MNHTIIDSILRSEEHTSELQSRGHLVCRLLLVKKNLTIMFLSIDFFVSSVLYCYDVSFPSFFLCSCPSRSLHSFPTRRSSDLYYKLNAQAPLRNTASRVPSSFTPSMSISLEPIIKST